VEALDLGALALSTGSVLHPQGKRVDTYNSIWRREADSRRKSIFDNGCPPCDCGAAVPLPSRSEVGSGQTMIGGLAVPAELFPSELSTSLTGRFDATSN